MNKGHFFIIARRAQWMYEAMKQSFAGHADIGVILDRRRRERRWQTIPIALDRRARERRTVNIDALLRQLGWVVVEQRAAGPGGRRSKRRSQPRSRPQSIAGPHRPSTRRQPPG